MDHQQLAEMAIDATKYSYAPYSAFHVGAALLAKSGQVYTGCNIESAAYPVTNCAERTALFKAVSEGERVFSAIAITASKKGVSPDYCYPCGVCRQALSEFVDDDFDVVVVKTATDYRVHRFVELLPFSFGSASMEG